MEKYVDLHCHLGSMSTAKELWEIAWNRGIKTVDSYEIFKEIIEGSSNTQEHKEYLDRFKMTHKIQSSPIAVENSVFQAISRSYTEDNVDHIELRFNPMLRNANKFYDVDAIILSACIGLMKATLAYPVKAGIIISTDRSFSSKMSKILVEKAIKYKNKGIIGFDMSGHIDNSYVASPNFSRLEEHKEAFLKAHKANLGVTIHTGEIKSSYSFYEMLHIAKNWDFVDRIGHGIRCVDNPDTRLISKKEENKLISLIDEKNIHLEICPTSNVVTKCVDGYENMRQILRRLREEAISHSINTDGVTFLNTSVRKEMDNCFLTEEGIKEYTKIAKNNSFV